MVSFYWLEKLTRAQHVSRLSAPLIQNVEVPRPVQHVHPRDHLVGRSALAGYELQAGSTDSISVVKRAEEMLATMIGFYAELMYSHLKQQDYKLTTLK